MTEVCRLHLLHIASGDLWAGAEVQLFTLAKTLHNKMGATVSVVLLNHGTLEQKLRESNIQVIVLEESTLNGFQLLLQLIRTVRELAPDIVHTHRIKENILGSIAAFMCGNIACLRTAHGAPEHRPALHHVTKRLILFLDWFCGRFFQDRVIAVSEDLARILNKEFTSDRIRIIENGIDLTSFIQPSENTASRSKALQTPFKVGIAGRLVPVKRIDLFIRAARQLLDKHPELVASFHIFGDGLLREELEALNHELKTCDIVHFEGHCEEITEQLQKLDVLLMTSDHEGLPMILLEAMALEIPIIAHAVGGISNLLDQGSCGVLVYDHSPYGYALQIYRLAQDREKRTKITRKALNRVTTYYTAVQNARSYCQEYAILTLAKSSISVPPRGDPE